MPKWHFLGKLRFAIHLTALDEFVWTHFLIKKHRHCDQWPLGLIGRIFFSAEQVCTAMLTVYMKSSDVDSIK